MTHLTEDELILHYYGEDDDKVVEPHLSQCANCRAEFQELQRVLALVSGDPLPERPPDYGDQVWRRLSPRLKRRRLFRWAIPVLRPAWGLPLAIAGALAAAFLLGRYWPQPGPVSVVRAPSTSIRARILLSSLSEHIERSQIALTELANTHGEGEVDISSQQSWAHEILEENRILRQSAVRAGDPAIVDLLEDLERILLEVENSPSRIDVSELDRLQRRIDSAGILFKMRVLGDRLRREQRAAIQALARRSS